MSGRGAVQAQGLAAMRGLHRRSHWGAGWGHATRWLVEPPLELVTPATRNRLKLAGWCYLIGHPLYWLLWTYWDPQPFASLTAHLALAAAGLVLLSDRVAGRPEQRASQMIAAVVFWIGLPLFFSWMYWMNGGNAVWLGITVAMIFVYFFVIDYRLALPGLLAGGALGAAAALVAGAPWPPTLVAAVPVFGFALVIAVIMGQALTQVWQLRVQRLTDAVGVLAHDLRTPLVTLSMLGQRLTQHAPGHGAAEGSELRAVAHRLHTVVAGMHHQIDLQIANAGLLYLKPGNEVIDAEALLAQVLRGYPFRLPEERATVTVQIIQNFRFRGSAAQFHSVFDNLLKNALRALAARDQPVRPGDVFISVGTAHGRGFIDIRDRGIGVAPEVLPRLFEPFVSSENATAHGLGLAYCRAAVQAADGYIRADPQCTTGARFSIDLPVIH
jgi:signal transduction histidine kinase